jgi:enediyne biosynthesis thioesterase
MSASFTYEHLVTFEDTHLMGSVYFANYLRWQGICRERFLAEHAAAAVAEVRSGELVLVTVSCDCEYLAELHAMDRVAVSMSLVSLRGSRIEMRFDYLRLESGSRPPELVARGHHTTACMRRSGEHLEPVPVPEELAEAIHGIGGSG